MHVKRAVTAADFQPSPDLKLEGRRIAVDPQSRRISVRVANFGEVHSGFDQQVRVPRNVNVDAAHVGVAELADGSTTRVATLPMDVMHAPGDLNSLHAASWYNDSGKGIARGRYSHDEHGLRFDGVLFDSVDDGTVDKVLAASASGDWRSAVAIKSHGDFETTPADFVGSCIVNIPGFSDTFSTGTTKRHALVASAAGNIISIDTTDDPALTALVAAGSGAVGGADSTTPSPGGGRHLPEGCSGECKGCSCQTPTVDVNDPSSQSADTVTLSASAVAVLVAASAGVDDEEVTAANMTARAALTAAGLTADGTPPATADDRLERLEKMVGDLTSLVAASFYLGDD